MHYLSYFSTFPFKNQRLFILVKCSIIAILTAHFVISIILFISTTMSKYSLFLITIESMQV